jgi:hypothetical protein
MDDETMKKRCAPAVLVLPERSHFELVELRDHVRLMGRLAEPGPASIDDDKRLRPHAFAWVFKRIGRDIERVIKSTYWSADVPGRAR